MQQVTRGFQRIRRKIASYSKVDFTKPFSRNDIMKQDLQVSGETCFGWEWDLRTKECSMCHDNEMCGLIFDARQKKLEAKLDKNSPRLDAIDFDGIDRANLFSWLKVEQRTTKELLDKVTEMSNCPEPDTVREWVKSYIIGNPKLYTAGGIVLIRN